MSRKSNSLNPCTSETTMTIPGHRHERVAEEILHELGIMVAGELKDRALQPWSPSPRSASHPTQARARLRQRDGKTRPNRRARSGASRQPSAMYSSDDRE